MPDEITKDVLKQRAEEIFEKHDCRPHDKDRVLQDIRRLMIVDSTHDEKSGAQFADNEDDLLYAIEEYASSGWGIDNIFDLGRDNYLEPLDWTVRAAIRDDIDEEADSEEDDSPRFENFYRHDDCSKQPGIEWNSSADSRCNDECPACGLKDIQPYKSEDMESGEM